MISPDTPRSIPAATNEPAAVLTGFQPELLDLNYVERLPSLSLCRHGERLAFLWATVRLVIWCEVASKRRSEVSENDIADISSKVPSRGR